MPRTTRNAAADRRLAQAQKDATLLQIAGQLLGLDTLETRNSDSLDFREQAVWNIKAALEAAYEAGREASNREEAA